MSLGHVHKTINPSHIRLIISNVKKKLASNQRAYFHSLGFKDEIRMTKDKNRIYIFFFILVSTERVYR